MYILGYFLVAAGKLLDTLLFFYMLTIIARAILSWVSPDPYNSIVRFLYNVTEPILFRIRSRIPVNFGGMDFSPMIIILAIYFIRVFLVNSLVRMGSGLL